MIPTPTSWFPGLCSPFHIVLRVECVINNNILQKCMSLPRLGYKTIWFLPWILWILVFAVTPTHTILSSCSLITHSGESCPVSGTEEAHKERNWSLLQTAKWLNWEEDSQDQSTPKWLKRKTTQQKLCDEAKAVLREQFIAINTYIKKKFNPVTQ